MSRNPPTGTYAATALAREGFQVHLLEKDAFPRYHIGESLLPSSRSFLGFIGAAEKVDKYGFTVKVGAALKLNQHKREGYADFDITAWNVVRSEFDEILLRHAIECGVIVHEEICVQKIIFSSEDPAKPVAAEWKSTHGTTGQISFEWLVDASGRNGIMSTKYLKNRRFNQVLRNLATWGYWSGGWHALTDETGWAWFIPLHNGTVSVGVVISEDSNRIKKSMQDSGETHYLTQLRLAPGLMNLLGDAKFTGQIKSAGDYSYSASEYAGKNYRVAGDAAAFIDPLFSSGVHLAFSTGLSAASTIAASIRGHCTEAEAILFHNQKTSTSYTRFLLAILGVYKQITSQESSALSDVNEDNFDRAFAFLRPVILGAADTDATVTEAMLQTTIDFFSHVVGVTTPEMHDVVSKRLDPVLMAPNGPILTHKAVADATGQDEEAKQVLWQINSKKGLDVLYDWENDFRQERLNGFSVALTWGHLGLRRDGV
ncbi:putative halogenase [Mycena venus]|uniref:Putative halogenase n=1 Tax=Mycena venus TaxID=2733690 RepID=A0A8H6X607_9AGAR|nr:putative halogenase [Mycena venus]